MDQEKEKKQKKQSTASSPICKNRMVLLSTAFIGILLIGIEVYIYLERKDIPMMGGLAICFVVDLFLMVNSIMNIDQINKEKDQQNYEDLIKAQKASYLVIRRGFDDLQDRLDDLQDRMDDLEDNSGIPAEDIIQAQKAIAKIVLSRSQDNAEALMNSNVELTKHLDEIADFTGSVDQKMQTYQKEALQQTKDLVRDENREIIREVRGLHDSIQNMQQSIVTISQAQHNLSVQSMMMAQPMQQPAPQAVSPAPAPVAKEAEELSFETDLRSQFTEPPLDDLEESFDEAPVDAFDENPDASFDGISDEISLDEDALENIDEVVSDDIRLDASEEDSLEDLSLEGFDEEDSSLEESDESETLSLDDLGGDEVEIGDLGDDNLGTEDLSLDNLPMDDLPMDDLSTEDLPMEDLSMDDISMEDLGTDDVQVEEGLDLGMEAEESFEEAPELEDLDLTIEEPEPVEEAVPEIEPVSEDPNAKLDPDQIAAMFAQASGGEAAPAPEPEEEPEPVEEAVPEIAPVSEDPNAKLDPDQIAAMFAQANGGEAAPAPEPEPEPLPEVQGDPNKMMTPEEIEALFNKM